MNEDDKNTKTHDENLNNKEENLDLENTSSDENTNQEVEDKKLEEMDMEDSNLDLQALLEEEKGKRLALMADFQNYQRRVSEEKSNWGAISNMALIQDLLEVSDDISLALNDETLDLDHSKTSLKSAKDKLVDSVLRAGVERIEINVGDEFNKEFMEAISTIPVKNDKEKNRVIAVISSAYKYVGKDFVLRAAKVVVGK